MGKWFKSPAQYAQVQYSISPFRAKLFDPIGYSFTKNFRRFSSNVFYIGIPIAIGYSIYAWGLKTNEFMHSKEGAYLKEEHS